MEPTQADLAAVSAVVDQGQPAPQPTLQPTQQPVQQPQPQYQQPTQPVQQPAPQQQPTQPVQQPSPQSQPQTDPFATFGQAVEPGVQQVQQPQPTQPTEPPTPQPQQPVEPTQPTPQGQPQQQPGQIAQQAQPQQQPTQQTETYEQYLDRVLQGLPEAPAQPDPSTVNPEDPEAIKNFFDTLMTTAEQRFEANYARKQAIQNAEKQLWEQAFDKYGSLRSNRQLRDMVHAIRRNEFQKGNAITPTQAAETLLVALQGQYQQGVADNQVVTTIESVQPQGGGTTTVPTTMDADKALLAVQTGGEQALAQVLEQKMQAGQM